MLLMTSIADSYIEENFNFLTDYSDLDTQVLSYYVILSRYVYQIVIVLWK
jgi:hypothetical protein